MVGGGEKGIESATLMSLSQLIDMALSGPEMGIVNFNLLQYLLHIVVNQLGLQDIKVEFRGPESEKMQKIFEPNKKVNPMGSSQYVVSGTPIKPVTAGKKIDSASSSFNTVVIVPTDGPEVSMPAFTVAMKKTTIDEMISDIDHLKQKYQELSSLPANSGLLEAVRQSDGKNTPIVDMYQILTLSKRMDATEVGVKKLASVIEDLAKEGGVKLKNTGVASESLEVKEEMNIKETKNVLQRSVEKKKGLRQSSGVELFKDSSEIKAMKEKYSLPQADFFNSAGTNVKREKQSLPQAVVAGEFLETTAGGVAVNQYQNGPDIGVYSQQIYQLEERVNELEKNVSELPTVVQQGSSRLSRPNTPASEKFTSGASGQKGDMDLASIAMVVEQLKNTVFGDAGDVNVTGRVIKLEVKAHEIVDEINNLDVKYGDLFNGITNQMSYAEKELLHVSDQMNTKSKSGGDNMVDLFNKVGELENILNQLGETVNELLIEKASKEIQMGSVMEGIELMKNTKVDKEELDELLADKVDICIVNRKVSHDQFNATCDDLTKSIEEALQKLMTQEEMWEQALQQIQDEVECKLDKQELNPLRDFVNEKLLAIQDKLKNLSKLKKEQEAAGAKSKFLRDVKCISCDTDVVMRKEMLGSKYPPGPSVQGSKGLGAKLAFELDRLRKEQRGLGQNRNLKDYETALGLGAGKRGRPEICNRYCGGSHTTTTAQQRVTRLGHFMEQWGPEVSQTKDVMLKGKDGCFYQGQENMVVLKEQETSLLNIPSLIIQGDIVAGPKSADSPVKKPSSPAGEGSSLEQLLGKKADDKNMSKGSIKEEK